MKRIGLASAAVLIVSLGFGGGSLPAGAVSTAASAPGVPADSRAEAVGGGADQAALREAARRQAVQRDAAASGRSINASTNNLAVSWTKTWGGSGNEAAHNLVVDSAGNLYVTGEFAGRVDFNPEGGGSLSSSHGSADVFLSKFDANGTFQWVRTWGGIGRDVPNGIGVDNQDNVYVSGPFQNSVDFNPDPLITNTLSSNAGGMNNIFLSKIDPNGALQWVRTWGPADAGAESYSLAIDGSDHIYVQGDFSGTTTNFNPWDPEHPDWHTNHPPYNGPDFDAFLSKFDENGNFIWARTWGGEGYDDGPGVAVDAAGNAYVGGMYASKVINFDPKGGSGGANHPAHDSGFVVDVFLSKFDAAGNFQWVRTWGGQGTDDAAETVALDGAGGVYVAGRFASTGCDFNPGGKAEPHSSHGSHDAFISKYDTDGNFQWAKTWGGSGWDAAGGLAVDGANQMYATGTFSNTVNFNPDGTDVISAQGEQDVFLSRFTADGHFQWAKTWGGSGNDWGYHIATGEGGKTVYVTGSFENTVDFNPGGKEDKYISIGGTDVFLIKLVEASKLTYIPLVTK